MDFNQGLQVPLTAINALTLSLLQKVLLDARGAAYVASSPELSFELIRLWLSTPSTGVTDQCKEFLNSLLSLDQYVQRYSVNRLDPDEAITLEERPGNAMWDRLITDHNLYSLIFAQCGSPSSTDGGQVDGDRRSIAQGRLIDLLSLALPAPYIWKSHFADVERKYGVHDGGLVHLTLHMVDDESDDQVMQHILVQFLTEVVTYLDHLRDFRNELSEALGQGKRLPTGINHATLAEVEQRVAEAEKFLSRAKSKKKPLVIMSNGLH